MSLKNKKISIVLSGGGAKGAYHAGFFRALDELGLSENITAISGSSIGAVNMALYLSGGHERVTEAWHGIGADRFESLMNISIADTLTRIKNEISVRHVGKERFCTDPKYAIFSENPLSDFISEYVSTESFSSIAGYACAYCVDDEKPEYFAVNGMDDTKLKAVITASCTIPMLWMPVKLGDKYYVDGGIRPPVAKRENEADKIPLAPLANEPADAVIISYLNPRDRKEISGFDYGTEFFHLHPSRVLESAPGTGTLDFRPKRLLTSEQLGYEDTIRFFEKHI